MDQSDLKNICEVSTHFYNTFAPLLYERITLRAQHKYILEDLDVEPLLQTCHTSNNLLRHAKHLEFRAAFHANLSNRCVHGHTWDSDPPDEDDSDSEEYTTLDELATSFLPLLNGFRDDSLRSFT